MPSRDSTSNLSLFEPPVPDGFSYRESFVSEAEAQTLLDDLQGLEFSNFEMRGAIARRRVAFFGQRYARSGGESPPIPVFLLPLRARIASWANVAADAFAMALVNEYRPGAPIGWHRDAPQYDLIAGLSLGAPCRLKFRRYASPRSLERSPVRVVRKTTHEMTLMPRSAYVMTGASRSAYEHSIPPVESLRYSVTFRTLLGGRP